MPALFSTSPAPIPSVTSLTCRAAHSLCPLPVTWISFVMYSYCTISDQLKKLFNLFPAEIGPLNIPVGQEIFGRALEDYFSRFKYIAAICNG